MIVDIAVFSALADPNRLRIIEVLRHGPTAVGAVADKLSLRQPLVSSHLKVLSRVGLVSVRPVAQRRLYELRPERFDDVATWAASFQVIWNERLDRFEAQLQQIRGAGGDQTDQPKSQSKSQRRTGG